MSRRLKPYIPFSGSLLFEPEDEADCPACQIHIGFTPKWFRQNAGVEFGERWHTDPDHRWQTYREMGLALNRIFPELRLGGRPEDTVGTISQIRTTAFMGALFGLPVRYFADNWPANDGEPLSDEQADRLTVPEIERAPAFEDLLRQMDHIEHRWGAIRGELNFQGVLNIAFRLRGAAIFTDMMLAPARAHRVLETACETMLRAVAAVRARRARTGAAPNYFVTANCTVNMIAAEQYRAFVQLYDRRLAAQCACFGVHNCAWCVDPYAEAYAEIGPLGYLDFGLTSDLARLKRLFPDTTLAPMVTPMDLVNKPLDALRADLIRLRDAVGRCRIVLADVEAETPPERVLAFYCLAAQVWEQPLETLPAPARNY